MNTTTLFGDRIKEILTVAKSDPKIAALLKDVKYAISRYQETVATMSRALQAQRFRLEGDELRELTQRLDTSRHCAHECLIDSITIANRYLFRKYGTKIPAGGVYSSSPSHLAMKDRIAIGDWALQIADVLQ